MAWQERGEMLEDGGDVGGDVQVGPARNKRFVNPEIPGAVVDVYVYAAVGDPNEPDLTDVGVECQLNYTLCTDIEDPGSTETWADVDYDTGFDVMAYNSVEEADAASLAGIKRFTADRIHWDGTPK